MNLKSKCMWGLTTSCLIFGIVIFNCQHLSVAGRGYNNAACCLCLSGETTSKGSALRVLQQAQSGPSHPRACCSASDLTGYFPLRSSLWRKAWLFSEPCVLIWTSSMYWKTKDMFLDKGRGKAKWFSKFLIWSPVPVPSANIVVLVCPRTHRCFVCVGDNLCTLLTATLQHAGCLGAISSYLHIAGKLVLQVWPWDQIGTLEVLKLV